MYALYLNATGDYVADRVWSATTKLNTLAVHSTAQDGIVLAGNYGGTIDLDPGAGTDSHTTTGTHEFLIQLTPTTALYQWGDEFTSSPSVAGMDIDSAGNIYTVGYYGDGTDFDPGPGTVTRRCSPTRTGAYLLKLTNAGSFSWVDAVPTVNFSEANYSVATAVRVTPTGQLDWSADFSSLVDVNPAAGADQRPCSGGEDCFWQQFPTTSLPQ